MGQLLPISVEGCMPQTIVKFLSDFEGIISKTDALAASTQAQKNRRKVESVVGSTPNSIANAVMSGYLQMVGQVRTDRRNAINSLPQSELTKDEVVLIKYREFIGKSFEGCEELLLTNKVENAAAKQGIG